MRYFDTQEGIKAAESGIAPVDLELLQRPSNFPVGPASSGPPLAKGSGVYVSPAAMSPEDPPPDAAPDTPSSRPTGHSGNKSADSSPSPASRRSKVHSIRNLPESPLQDGHMYPVAPPTWKSSTLDVYGQPRLESGRLPEIHMREEAPVYLNNAYLEAEEATMRVGKTSSLNLVRAKGHHLRQFQVSPNHLHFGTVTLGQVMHKVARLTNISNEIARFTLVRAHAVLRTCSTDAIHPSECSLLHASMPRCHCCEVASCSLRTAVFMQCMEVGADMRCVRLRSTSRRRRSG